MFSGLILAALVGRGGDEPKAAEPVYEFDAVKETSVAAVPGKDRTVFVVTDPFGIGQAGIRLKGGQWPAKVVVRFQRKTGRDGGFTNLEHIGITTDRVHAVGSLMMSGKFDFGFLDEKREKPRETLAPDGTAGRLKVLVEDRNGAIEVTLPRHLLAGSTKLELDWIDAYRK